MDYFKIREHTAKQLVGLKAIKGIYQTFLGASHSLRDLPEIRRKQQLWVKRVSNYNLNRSVFDLTGLDLYELLLTCR